MSEIIDVDSYKPKKQCDNDATIDDVLNTNNLFRLQAFSYTPGDCLFNAIEVLLHFLYTSTKLRNGTMDHFLMCLEQGHIEALESFNYELAPNFQYHLHGICDIKTYLRRIRLLASNGPIENERGLWGDKFCICSLAEFINRNLVINKKKRIFAIKFKQNNKSIAYIVP